ncbi:CRE-CLC-1 protein, partial [Aphelenchoides avenae]
NKEPWQRAVAAFMIIAILIELVVLVWAVISCLACCCPELFYPLPILCALATVCLIIAMSIFGAKNKNEIKDVPDNKGEWDSQSNIGYSFWVGIVALVAMAIASLVGAVVSMASKYAP